MLGQDVCTVGDSPSLMGSAMTDRFERVVGTLPAGIERLLSLSLSEGHRHISRLIDEWQSGAFRFDGPDDRLLAAHADDTLIAIGGVTRDPYQPDCLRMRRFYVDPAWRHRGIGGRLAKAIIAACPVGTAITAHAPITATAFWAALGFQPCTAPNHNMILPPSCRRPS